MLRSPQFASIFVLGLCASAGANADSLTDNLGPRELAVGESMRAEAVGALSTVLNPAGLALNRQLVFAGSYGFRSEDNASVASFSACDSTTPIAGCFYYHYLSAEPEIAGMDRKRRFHEGGFTAARALTPQLLLGSNTHFFDYNSDLEGEEDVRGYSVDLGLIFVASPGLNVAAVGYNLVGTESAQYPRGMGTGIAFRPGQGSLGINLDALWNIEEKEGRSKGRYGGGLEYFLRTGGGGAGYPVRGGGVYDAANDTSYLTLGLGYANPKIGIDIGGRKQVSGGDELIIQAGLRLIGPTPQR